MESRMYDGRHSKHRVKVNERSLEDEEKTEEEVVEEEKPKSKSRAKRESKPKTVRLVLQKRKRVRVTGAVSGKEYVFPGAGSELDVDERDVPALLAKGAGRKNCCGGAQPSPYFQIVK